MFKLIFHLILIGYIVANPVEVDQAHESIDIIKYINDVKSNIDSTVDPCDDFEKYACGSNRELEDNDPKSKERLYEYMLMKKIFSDKETETDHGKLIKDLFANCDKTTTPNYQEIFDQIDFLKEFGGKFPINSDNDFDNKFIAKLVAEINVIHFHSGFIHFTPNDNKGKFSLRFNSHTEYETLIDFYYKMNPQKTRINDKIEDDQILKLKDFMEKLGKIYANYNFDKLDPIEFNSTTQLNEILPAKNFDWDTFFEVIDSKWNLETKNLKIGIGRLGKFKEFLKVIDSVDTKTLANYLVFRYVTDWNIPDNCIFIMSTMGRVKAVKYLLSSEIDIQRYLKFLNRFSTDLKDSSTFLQEADTHIIKTSLEAQRNFFENSKKVTSIDLQEDLLFADYEIGHFYGNLAKIFPKIVRPLLKYYISNDELEYGFLLGQYIDVMPFENKNTPSLFYDITQSKILWLRLFQTNSLWGETNYVETCINQTNPNIDFAYSELIVNANAAVHMSLKYFNKNYNLNIDGHIDDNFDQTKLFYIGFAQNSCHLKNTSSSLQRFSHILKSIQMQPEFVKSFKCKNQSVKICELEDTKCPIENKYLLNLLPFEIKNCNN